MSNPTESLTTQQFAKKAAVSTRTVSKWLRNGTINGEKISGKWSIPETELAKVVSSQTQRNTRKAPNPSVPKAGIPADKTQGKSYSVEEFSAMTYLTEFGVQKWLKEGRLEKITGSDGTVMVAASNLHKPDVKRLLR